MRNLATQGLAGLPQRGKQQRHAERGAFAPSTRGGTRPGCQARARNIRPLTVKTYGVQMRDRRLERTLRAPRTTRTAGKGGEGCATKSRQGRATNQGPEGQRELPKGGNGRKNTQTPTRGRSLAVAARGASQLRSSGMRMAATIKTLSPLRATKCPAECSLGQS